MSENKSYEATADVQNVTLQSTGDAPQNPPAYTPGSTQPPSYQDVEHNAPPPSYDSLYGRAKAIREESSSNVDFIKKIIFLILGTVGFTIFLAVLLAIPIAMIAMGAVYIDDCKAERYIPIYLIVAGSFGIIRNIISIVRRCRGSKEEREENQKKVNPLESVIDCFMFAWFIAGNVWVYGTKGDFSGDPNADNYCDSTLYWFAFWMITIVYIFAGACCCCCCFCGIMAAVFGSCKK